MKQNLLLHVGLPKTGTSAFQTLCHHRRFDLLESGVDYPEVSVGGGVLHAKHQALVSGLLANREVDYQHFLRRTIAPTVLLSAEGLSNHAFDFEDEALQAFGRASSHMHRVVFVVVRDKREWTRSMYKQCVINPTNRRFLYGTTLTFEAFRRENRIQRLCDHETIIQRLKVAFAPQDVLVAHYEDDWQGHLFKFLGVELSGQKNSPPGVGCVNVSIDDETVETIRRINEVSATEAERIRRISEVELSERTGNETLLSYLAMRQKLKDET